MREKRCEYHGTCGLQTALGDDICRICTIGPRERTITRNLRRGMWVALIMNLAAFAFNLVRAIMKG